MDANDWDAKYLAKDMLWGIEPNRFVVDVVADFEPGRALDLACGEGRNAVWLATKGWDVTAVDFSPVALERGRELAGEHGVEIDWIERDVLAVEFDAEFDLVLGLYLHLPPEQRLRLLGSAAAAVAPGGHLLVVGHARRNIDEGHGGPQDPDLLYEPEHLVADLSAESLDMLRAESVTRSVTTDAGDRTAIDTLVLGRRRSR